MYWSAVTLLSFALFTDAHRVKIGRISGPQDDARLTTEEFWSYSPDSATSLTLEPETRKIRWWNTLDVTTAVCRLAERGAKAVVAEGPLRLSPLIAIYSTHLQLPSIGGMVDVVPDTSPAAAQLIKQWDSFAFIYQTDTGADQLQQILRLLDHSPRIEAFWRTNGVEETLELVKTLPDTPLVLASSESLADELLTKLATLRRNFDIMLLTPMGNIRKKNSPGSYRLIQFSFVDQDSPALKGFENRWKTIRGSSNHEKELPDSALLNHEASKVLQSLFSSDTSSERSIHQFDCFNYSAGFELNALKKVSVQGGLTGEIKFDSKGKRKGYKLHIYEEKPFDLKKIGSWSEDTGLQISKNIVQLSPSSAAFKDESQRPLRVTSIFVKPFLYEGQSGNLEGYTVDFLEELMAILHYPYEIQLVKDQAYGRKMNGVWNGMIGELVRNEADIAVAPLTKTREREQVVDFSKSFMTFGLNILMKKPDSVQHERSSFSPFSFLKVWSAELWIVLMLSVVALGAACFLISRFAGSPDRVRALESKGTDNLSPCGSIWFTVASLLQRDTGIYPRTFSHRVWAALWWFLCFFVAVGYISSLTAALTDTRRTVTNTHSRKTSHEVIQDLLEKGAPDIGLVKSGSTMNFFLKSDIGVFQDFARYLERNPDVPMSTYDQGAMRVRQSNGSYAFIMESPGSQFHVNIEPCDTYSSTGYLTTKSHSVGLQKNSPYKDMIDHGILVLLETGTLRTLYEKWWHNYSSACEDPNMDILPKVYSRYLRLHEVSGVFYILILFAFISVAAAFIEKYYSSNKQTTLD